MRMKRFSISYKEMNKNRRLTEFIKENKDKKLTEFGLKNPVKKKKK